MPPKETAKKYTPVLARPRISDSSLYYVPGDVIEGYQDRLETGIDWTLLALATRHHKKLCKRKEIPTVTFSEALENKLKNSIFGGFLDENSDLTLDQQWEVLMPMKVWDNDMLATDEGKICFRATNNITDDMINMVKKAVKVGDRNILRNEIMMVNTLRVGDSEMTELDIGLYEFTKLISLCLCGNFIDNVAASVIPPSVKLIELQGNRIGFVEEFAENLPKELLYLGLARNLLSDDNVVGLSRLPRFLTVLDISDNDIYDLEPVLDALVQLPDLVSLTLVGNPCSVCMGYARVTLMRLPRLLWLDNREILSTDRSVEPFEPHPDDFRSAYFHFTVFRVMSAAQPPKPEKGAVTTFHIELEIPLLDSRRRQFLMFRRNESLTEMLPPPEDDETWVASTPSNRIDSRMMIDEASSHESDIYKVLTIKNSREIIHSKIHESNRVQWNKVMNFTEPVIKLFCPDLKALKDTFNTVITVRLIYSLTSTAKPVKSDKKSQHSLKVPEQRVVVATMKCTLKQPDWSQNSQHFHWDDSLGTNDAIHWGDGDLSVLQYTLVPVKTPKAKPGETAVDSRHQPPDNLTCHFGFGIDTLHP